jgi:hypothetical protein
MEATRLAKPRELIDPHLDAVAAGSSVLDSAMVLIGGVSLEDLITAAEVGEGQTGRVNINNSNIDVNRGGTQIQFT